MAKRLGDDGESVMDLHWLRPCRDAVLRGAASMNLDKYGSRICRDLRVIRKGLYIYAIGSNVSPLKYTASWRR